MLVTNSSDAFTNLVHHFFPDDKEKEMQQDAAELLVKLMEILVEKEKSMKPPLGTTYETVMTCRDPKCKHVTTRMQTDLVTTIGNWSNNDSIENHISAIDKSDDDDYRCDNCSGTDCERVMSLKSSEKSDSNTNSLNCATVTG